MENCFPLWLIPEEQVDSLLTEELALKTGKISGRLAQEQCGKATYHPDITSAVCLGLKAANQAPTKIMVIRRLVFESLECQTCIDSIKGKSPYKKIPYLHLLYTCN